MSSNLARCQRILPRGVRIDWSRLTCVAAPVHPLTGGGLLSRYGERRGRTTGERMFHAGTDLRARIGDPVFSVLPGVVEAVSNEATREGAYNGYGNAVVVRHDGVGPEGQPVWSFYAHLSRALVRVGQVVTVGQMIGEAGNTTNGKFRGMGPHLHFELRIRFRDRSPFPSPYCAANIAPEPVLESGGVRLLFGGGISVRGSGECGLRSAKESYQRTTGRAMGNYYGLAEDPTYEPPAEADWDVRLGLSGFELGVLAGIAGLGILWFVRRS